MKVGYIAIAFIIVLAVIFLAYGMYVSTWRVDQTIQINTENIKRNSKTLELLARNDSIFLSLSMYMKESDSVRLKIVTENNQILKQLLKTKK